MSQVKAVPEGIPPLLPMLVCADAAAEMEFCREVFGAIEMNRRPGPDGTVAHGLMAVGEAVFMIECVWPGLASRAPALDATSPVVLYLYLPDVDDAVARAERGGATVLMPPEDRFWGDRTCRIMDPAGHVWTLATRVEESAEEERQGRWAEILARPTDASAA